MVNDQFSPEGGYLKPKAKRRKNGSDANVQSEGIQII